MPKMKTKRAAAKRFSKTGSGKIKRTKAFGGHLLENRPHGAKKRAHKAGYVHSANLYQVERMLINS